MEGQKSRKKNPLLLCDINVRVKNDFSPGCCGSVGWSMSHKPKGCGFDS